MLDDRVPALHFDTADLPAGHGFEMWRNILGEIYDVPEPVADQPAFGAAITIWNIGGVLLTDGSFGAQRFLRPEARARRDGFDNYTLLLHRSGHWRAVADDDTVDSGPGRVCFLDFARPVVTDTTANDSITMSLPRDLLDDVLSPRDLHLLALDGARGGLLADFMMSLTRRASDLAASDAAPVAAACRDMLAACIAPSAGTVERARPQIDALSFRRAKRLIDANLHRPEWGAEELRRALGVSRATLYRIFERFGGVAEQIMQRRLIRAHALLTQPDRKRRVSEVAYDCGFTSAAHFSRSFRNAYGYTAREVTGSGLAVAHRQDPAPPRTLDEATVIDWVRQLCV